MHDISTIDNPASMSCIVDAYDGFIVDQFGVLHDGQKPYPAAISTLQLLMNAGKTVVILSNSGKRSHINAQRMTTLGFGRNTYTEFVTSGDVAFEKVQTQYLAKGLRRCLLIARDNDLSAVEGLDLELVSRTTDAEFVIISASEGDRFTEKHYIKQLRSAAQRCIPCLCTNPDKLMITRQGIRFGAGRIAELYEQMGGAVQWIGKPYKDVYIHALDHLKAIDAHRILCVGDSLEHDIAGGATAGLKTLFIRGGIHREMDDMQINQYLARHTAMPDHWMQSFG